MNSNMIKSQHVVPRAYLKLFENSNNRVFSYNWRSNLYAERIIEKVCEHNYTYEVSNNDVDNVLEIALSKLETKFMPSIHKILDHVDKGTLNRSCIDSEICYKYIMLQYMRSDSGRVLMGRAMSKLSPLNHHISLDEIAQNKDKDQIFNIRFKNENELERTLNLFYYYDHPLIKVGVSKERKFLTSDNPVIALYLSNDGLARKLVLPISPRVCLYCASLDFERIYQNEQESFPYEINKDLAIKYNQSIINVSNYWIISQDRFDIIDWNSIYNRRIK